MVILFVYIVMQFFVCVATVQCLFISTVTLDNPLDTLANIINEEDIVTFLSSKPSPGNLDMTKHELQLIVQYLGMNIPSEWNKPLPSEESHIGHGKVCPPLRKVEAISNLSQP